MQILLFKSNALLHSVKENLKEFEVLLRDIRKFALNSPFGKDLLVKSKEIEESLNTIKSALKSDKKKFRSGQCDDLLREVCIELKTNYEELNREFRLLKEKA